MQYIVFCLSFSKRLSWEALKLSVEEKQFPRRHSWMEILIKQLYSMLQSNADCFTWVFCLVLCLPVLVHISISTVLSYVGYKFKWIKNGVTESIFFRHIATGWDWWNGNFNHYWKVIWSGRELGEMEVTSNEESCISKCDIPITSSHIVW